MLAVFQLSDRQTAYVAIAPKLQRETKSTLINLVYELAVVSPEAQRFSETRYLKKSKTVDKIAPYRQVIQEQFAFSDWNNTVTWNFAGVHKAIHNYDKSSQGDPGGMRFPQGVPGSQL